MNDAKWGTGAINALSERLQVELPGLRGFSPQHIRFMRQFYDEWNRVLGVVNNGSSEIRYLPSSESADELRYLTSSESNAVTPDELMSFLAIGFTHHRAIFGKCKSLDERWHYITACAKEHWTVIELERHIAADDYKHVGALPNNFAKLLPIATYQALKNIPRPYKSLAPVIDGVRRVMVEYKDGLAKAVPTTGKAKKRKSAK